jgi:HD-like signal output (HDOD) protein
MRWFAHMQLLRLLGRSERTMAWRVADARHQEERLLVLPREPMADDRALVRWQAAAQQVARLSHPQLAAPVDIGVHENWPYIVYALKDQATLLERLTPKGLPGTEATALVVQMLNGLAFAHESGAVHHDVQAYLMLVSDSGKLCVAGAAVASESALRGADGLGPDPAAADLGALRVQRQGAQRDVLSVGVLMHGLLAGEAALGELDTGRVIKRIAPLGNEGVRLPWSMAYPVGEALRAIVNRSTDRQDTRRYRSARPLLRALEGWLQSDAQAGGGPLALLLDRLSANGALPSSPGAAARAARLALMDRSRTNELAEVVLEDLALAFELLRGVNTAQVRGAQLSGAGPVLTVRRAIAMLGLDGVRRSALVLREWPGPLNETAAAELERLVQRCKRAGRLAVSLRPAGYDGEVIYLIALMQNLGRLVLQYHFPEEAQQIRRLMLPVPPTREGETEEPGMPEDAASYAVLGADPMALGLAVARHWGLDESVLTMVRPLPFMTPVRQPDTDDELLRTVASCGNEAIDALALPPARVQTALQRVVQRYGRILGFTARDLQAALTDKTPSPITAEPSRMGALDGQNT